MRILFDTNVVLDVLLNRKPHAAAASRLFVYVERNAIEGLLGATTVTTIHYLATKAVGKTQARKHLRTLLALFEVAPVNGVVILDALSLNFTDYEDAVLYEAAHHAGAGGIVTRNVSDFSRSTLPIYTPDELLKVLLSTPSA